LEYVERLGTVTGLDEALVEVTVADCWDIRVCGLHFADQATSCRPLSSQSTGNDPEGPSTRWGITYVVADIECDCLVLR